jgi:hypothetical protein
MCDHSHKNTKVLAHNFSDCTIIETVGENLMIANTHITNFLTEKIYFMRNQSALDASSKDVSVT